MRSRIPASTDPLGDWSAYELEGVARAVRILSFLTMNGAGIRAGGMIEFRSDVHYQILVMAVVEIDAP